MICGWRRCGFFVNSRNSDRLNRIESRAMGESGF
jgi:hypothetical protein